MNADPGRAKALFLAAIEMPDRASRDAFLDRECGQDPALRRRVEALLQAHDDPQSVLDRPLAGIEADTQAMAQPSTSSSRGSGATAAGSIVGGRYKLLEAIGEGGMGEVWVADQLVPIRRRVALKLIKPGMDSRSILARFEAERQALAMMDHPNIAKVLDAGASDDGRPWFAMELVKGTPITEFCDARRLSPHDRLELFIPVCQAIQHAHQKGIIHRDIKPGNVLVELHDERMVPKVIDFGVAKAVGQSLTEQTLFTGFGTLVGTPAYMAPEQAAFNAVDIDTRADVYALGVLLYELLTGTPPVQTERFRQAALDEVLRLVREEDPPPPSDRLSTSSARASIAAVRQTDPARLAKLVRGDLDWIVMKALEKDRARRYETASALARDVERYLGDEPVEAHAPSFAYRVRKMLVRHQGVAIAAGLIGVVVLLGTLISTWQAVRAVRARHEEQRARYAAEEARQRALDHESEARKQRDDAVQAHGQLERSQEKILADAYAWDLQMIPLAWDGGNVGRADEMLSRHRPIPRNPTDLRGFEWRYWDRQLHAERRKLQLPGRPASAPGWAMSDDGSLVLTIVTEAAPPAAQDRSSSRPAAPQSPPTTSPAALPTQWLKVWDTASGKQVLRQLLEAAPGRAHFSNARFSRDNRRLALSWGTERRQGSSGSPDGGMTLRRVRVIDMADGKTLLDCVEPNLDIERWNLSPDGKRMAVIFRGSPFRTTVPSVKMFDVDAGKLLFILPGEADGELSPPFSEDGARFAVVGVSREQSEARICDTSTGKVISSWKVTCDAAPLLAFTPDGGRLAGVLRSGGTASPTWAVKLWETDGGKELFSTTPPHAVGGRTTQFRHFFNADGSRLAVVGRSQGVTRGPEAKILDVANGNELFSFTARHAQDTQAFSPDGKRIVSTEGAVLTIRDATSGQIERTLRGHLTRVVTFSQTQDGRMLRAMEEDGTLKEWDLQPAEPVVISKPDRAGVGAVAFSADGSMLAAVTVDQPDAAGGLSVSLFESATGKLLRQCPVPERTLPTRASYWLTFGGGESRVALIRSQAAPTQRFSTTTPPTIAAADLVVWDPLTGRQVAAVEMGKVVVQGFALNADGTHAAVATAGVGNTPPELKWFDVTSGQVRQTTAIPGFTGGLISSPDGRRIAGLVSLPLKDAWTPAGVALKLWDAAGGQEIASMTLEGAQPTIAWSGDGTMLAAGFKAFGGQAVVQLFDAGTGRLRLTVNDPAGAAGNRTPSGLVFSADGRRVAAHLGGPAFVNRAESEVKLWETATGREMLSLKSTVPAQARLAFGASGEFLAEVGQPVGNIGRALPARGSTLNVWHASPRRENP